VRVEIFSQKTSTLNSQLSQLKILAQPRGFCAGVDRAIEIVERAIKKYGAPVYVRHEIVHNKYVVDDLKRKGAIFVEEISEIPDGAVTVFSAHGVSEKVESEARLRNLPIIDATCPLVTKVHIQAQKSEAKGAEIILIGHDGHPEVEGTSGRVKNGVMLVENVADVAKIQPKNPDNLAYVTQTTLSVDETKDIIFALIERFPSIQGPGTKDICYATQNRQDAVRELAKQTDLVLVVGANYSSNSVRLKDLSLELGTQSYLIDSAKNIEDIWFKNCTKIGVTAGASAPELLVEQVVDHIKNLYPKAKVSIMNGIEENIKFRLPKEVRKF
jgi:4-hydroxy-3-methylbut-2-en-1-yl diphosphate reductase